MCMHGGSSLSAGQLQAPSVAQTLPGGTNSHRHFALFCALSKHLSPAHLSCVWQLPIKCQLFNKAKNSSCEESGAEFGSFLIRCFLYGIRVNLSSKRHCDTGTKEWQQLPCCKVAFSSSRIRYIVSTTVAKILELNCLEDESFKFKTIP